MDGRAQQREVTNFYGDFFNIKDAKELGPWDGQPRPLEPKIDARRIKEIATQHLKNGRTAGEDQTQGELFKYGGEQLHQCLADVIIMMFAKHEYVTNFNSMILVPLNKKGKEPRATNTRAIQLVNMVRKILSGVVLKEMQNFAEGYVTIN
jgi:hypothetical protein